MSNAVARIHLPQIDFIKTAAIILIVAFHFFGELSGWHMKVINSAWLYQYWQTFDFLKLIKFVEAYFYLGVNLFVISSGFGLCLSYIYARERLDLSQYFKKRILRLIPGAFIAIIVVFLLKGIFLDHWPTENWYLNFYPFFGGLNLLADKWFFPPINGEIWFLGLIIQLYLLFPLLVKTLEKIGTIAFLWLTFGISIIFRIIYFIYFRDSASALAYGFSIGRVFEFGFGMVAAKNFAENKRLSLIWTPGVMLFFGYFYSLTFPFVDALLGVALFTILWSAATMLYSRQKKQKFFDPHFLKKIVKNVSTQSYMIFLIHHPLIWIFQKYGLKEPWSTVGILLFAVLFIISYHLAKILNILLKLVII